MVTMFITPEKIGAFYLCHVCEEQLSSGDVLLHLCSNQHYFRYLVSDYCHGVNSDAICIK